MTNKPTTPKQCNDCDYVGLRSCRYHGYPDSAIPEECKYKRTVKADNDFYEMQKQAEKDFREFKAKLKKKFPKLYAAVKKHEKESDEKDVLMCDLFTSKFSEEVD